MKILSAIIFLMLCSSSSLIGQTSHDTKLLLIRCDDIGMSHSVNMAARELLESGLNFSASIMFTCPWYQEAVELLKNHPEIAVGIHLTLNSEWKNYRWGPVAGASRVSTIVDSNGLFFPSRALFFANNPKPDEIEIELRAQIERAINSGLKISYLDYHMGTAVDKPELRKMVENLANEYNLAISRYFGEIDVENVYSVPIENKKDSLFYRIEHLMSDKINLLVCHIGKDNDELKAMIDLNSFGLKEMSAHRESELNALLKAKQEKIFEKNNIRTITYNDLIKEFGLKSMKSPEQTGY